jgi:branched-chain amino acid transport system substrate-binding protein
MIRPIRARPLAVSAGAIAIAAVLLLGCSSSSSDTSSDVAGATCPEGTTIAFMGRFDEAEPVAASSTQLGARLAVDEFNAANPKCQVTLDVEAGSGGDAAATAAAKKIVASTQVLAVVGPQRSGDVEVAGPVFNTGGVPFVSATATRTDLSAQGWNMFHRVVGTNKSLGSAAAQYMTETLDAGKIAVIDDGTPYAADLAATVTNALGARATVVGTITDDPGSVGAIVAELAGFGTKDAVYFAGYELEAADLLRQMRVAGIGSTFVGSDTLPSATFLGAAGIDAEGVIATCLCAPLSKISAGEDFAKRFRAEFPNADPNDEYAAEAFDATNLILSTIAAGNHDRSSVANALSTTTWVGITRTINFDANGDVVDPVVWVSEVRGGSFQPIASVTAEK